MTKVSLLREHVHTRELWSKSLDFSKLFSFLTIHQLGFFTGIPFFLDIRCQYSLNLIISPAGFSVRPTYPLTHLQLKPSKLTIDLQESFYKFHLLNDESRQKIFDIIISIQLSYENTISKKKKTFAKCILQNIYRLVTGLTNLYTFWNIFLKEDFGMVCFSLKK